MWFFFPQSRLVPAPLIVLVISDDVKWWILGHQRRTWPSIFTAENYKLLVPHFLCGEGSRTSHLRTSTVNTERRRCSSCSRMTSPAWQWGWGAPPGVNWCFWCKHCLGIETEIEYLCYSKHQWSIFFSRRNFWITLRSIWTKGWWSHIFRSVKASLPMTSLFCLVNPPWLGALKLNNNTERDNKV